MSFVVPTPAALVAQFAAALEGVSFIASDGSVVTLDATDPTTLEGILAVVTGMGLYELYLYLGTIAREVMPDTAVDWLPRHGAIWGRPQEPARQAVGNLVATASAAAPVQVPAGTEAQSSGSLLYATTVTMTVPANGTASIPAQAVSAGAASNLVSGASLTLVSAIAGLVTQTLSVDAGGMAGGADIETIESWRAGILIAIRTRPGNGKASDYVTWSLEAGASSASVLPAYQGAGTIGVVIAMPGPVAPTPSQLAAVQSYLAARCPVEATVIVVAASLQPINHAIAINPDTVANRAAVQSQLAASFAATAAIGTPWYLSTSYSALASVGGLVSYRTVLPAADVPITGLQMPVLGAVNFVDPY